MTLCLFIHSVTGNIVTTNEHLSKTDKCKEREDETQKGPPDELGEAARAGHVVGPKNCK